MVFVVDILKIFLKIAALVLFFYFSGYPALRFFLIKKLIDISGRFERIFLAIVFSVIITGLTGLSLALLGIFSLLLVTVICAAIGLIFFLLSFKGKPAASGKPPRVEVVFFVAVIVIAALLWHNPFSYLFGGWDPGTYINTGVHIARTGDVNYTDPFFAGLPEESKKLFTHHRQYIYQRFPGFLIADFNQGRILPQFHHIYPVWLALFYSLFGIRFALYVTCVFGLLSLAAIYFVSEKYFNRRVGMAAVILLLFNVAQIWQVRFQTSEVMAQFSLFTVIYMLGNFFRRNEITWGVAGMLAFAYALFIRYDSLLYLPVIALGLYLMLVTGRGKYMWLPAVVMGLIIGGFIMYKKITFLYLPLWHVVVSRQKIFIVTAIIVGVAAVLYWFLYKKYRPALEKFFVGKELRWVTVILIVLLAGYAYFIRPGINHTYDGKNFTALGWFMTPWGLAMGVAGVGIFILKLRRLEELFLIAMGFLAAVVYIYTRLNDDFYMWTVRRYIPMVIPAFTIFIACFITRVAARIPGLRLVASSLLILIVVAPPLWRGRIILQGDDWTGAEDFLEEYASALDPDGIYICNGYWLAEPLNLIYGIRTLSVSDIDEKKVRGVFRFLRKALEEKQNVYYIGPETAVYSKSLNFEKIKNAQFTSHMIQHSRFVPRQLEENKRSAKLYKTQPIELNG